MTTTGTTSTTPQTPFAAVLRRLYLVRFAFAIAWAGVLFPTATDKGPLLTGLVIVYPLFDAAAVLWQLRSPSRRLDEPRVSEWFNVVVSVVVAAALGWASTESIGAALAVWGVWAIVSGAPQLITAVQRRRSGGQVAQILSGGISVIAGISFLVQGSRDADSMGGVGGYAILGGVFFLISALRLGSVLRKGERAAR